MNSVVVLRNFVLGILLVAIATVALAVAATGASAATYGMTAFDLTPDTTQAGGHPKVTYFADFDANTAWSTGDDIKKVVVDYPAGLLANPEAATTKCSETQYLADNCPGTSKIGSLQLTIKTGTSVLNSVLALGDIYVMAQTETGSAATIAFIVRPIGYRKLYLKTKATGIIGVRTGLEQYYGLTLTIDNIPKTLTKSSGAVQEATINRVWVQTPQKVNGKYFSFNPTRCTEAKTRIQGFSANGITMAPLYDAFTPTACDKVPFAPTGTVTPTSTTIGSPVGWNAEFNVPTADTTIQQSHVKNVTVDLPTGTTLNFPVIASIAATCTATQLEADACPAGSKIGTASAAVPFLAPASAGQPSMPGDIYLMSRLTGIKFGYVLRSKDGLKAALTGAIGSFDADDDGSSDFIRATAFQLPQAPWSQVKMNFTSQMINNPAKCATTSVKSKLDSWSGKTVNLSNTVKFVAPSGGTCPGTENQLPQVSISSPANGAFLTTRSIPVNFTATDADVGQTLTRKCELFNTGSSIVLSVDNACTSPKTFATGADGNFTVRVTATDGAGGVSTASVDVKVDTVGPVAVVTSPANDGNVVNGSSISLQFVVQDANPSSGLKPVTCVLARTAPAAATISTDAACVTPKTYTGLSNGNYSFTVTAQDNAGNTTVAVRTFTIAPVLDNVAPTITITAPTAGQSLPSPFSASWSITDTAQSGVTPSGVDPSSVRCSLAGPTPVAETFCPGSGRTFSGFAYGNYVLTVKASDFAGNQTTATRSFAVACIDCETPPQISITSPTQGQIYSTGTVAAAWTITDTAVPGGPTGSGISEAATTCALAGPTPVATTTCPNRAKTFNGLANGSYTLTVTAYNNRGDVGVATRNFSVAGIDTTPPTVTISAPTAGQVLTTDSVAVAFAATDTAPPGVPPSGIASTTCTLTGPTSSPSMPCTSVKVYSGITTGNYTVSVYATDGAGNVGVPATRSFSFSGTHDNQAPDLSISYPFAGSTIAARSIVASWEVTDHPAPGGIASGVNSVKCGLAGPTPSAFGTCGLTDKTFSGLANGAYVLTVQAFDNAGNDVTVTRSFSINVVDILAPQIVISAPISGQTLTTNSVDAAWTITDVAQGSEPPSGVASITCTLSSPGYVVDEGPCPAGGKTFTGLTNGNHFLIVEAVDNAGNSASKSVGFLVNVPIVLPAVSISAPAADQILTTNSVQPTWTVSPGTYAIHHVACKLSGPTPSPEVECPGNSKLFSGLANGDYLLTVSATDNSANVGSATRAFTVAVPPLPDTQGPVVNINAPAAGQVVGVGTPLVATWTATDVAQSGVTPSGVNDSLTTCSLTGPSTVSVACPGGVATFPGLPTGNYVFSVTVHDNAGNLTVATRQFVVMVIDNFDPNTNITTYGAAAASSASSLTVVANTDTGTSIEYSLNDGSSWVPCSFVNATKTGTCTIPLSAVTGPSTLNYKIRASTAASTDPTPANGYTWVDNRPVKGTATVTPVANASTTAMGLAPNAPGAHPDIVTQVSLEGSEDTRSVSVQMADGLMGSLAAVPKAQRCTPRQATEGNCPASSEIASGSGTGVSVLYGTLSGASDIQGKVYMVDVDSPAADEAAGFPDIASQYAAAGAVEVTSPSHPDLGRINVVGGLKVVDNGRALVVEVNDLPRATNLAPEASPGSWVIPGARVFHATTITATVDGDKGYVTAASVTATNKSRPLVTNPHYCGATWAARPGMKHIQATAVTWNGSAITDGNAAIGFAGKVSAIYNTATAPCVAGQAFNPAINALSFTNAGSGQTTGITASGSLGEEADAINGNKPVSTATYVSTQLPPFVGVSTPSVGSSLDQCTVDTFVARPGGEVFDTSVDRDPSLPGVQQACPPQAIVGTAYIDSPLIDTQLLGNIYYVVGSPIPNIGIEVSPTVEDPRWKAFNFDNPSEANPYQRFPNPQGVTIGVVGRTSVPDYVGNEWFKQVVDADEGIYQWHFGNCIEDAEIGQSCNQAIKVTINSLADVPITNLKLDLGDRRSSWRPRSTSPGFLDANPLVIAGCTDPTFPWTEANGDQVGPPLVAKFTPYSKQTTNVNGASAIQSTVSKSFQPITGCPAGTPPVEGETP